jgi:hypothetical protein
MSGEATQDTYFQRIKFIVLTGTSVNLIPCIGMDEDLVSIALGFACQLVVMLAHYLNVPLRYPLTPMGSKAFVIDPVSLLVGPKE